MRTPGPPDPPGPGRRDGAAGAIEVDRAGLEILDRPACLYLLAGVQHGRIALNVGALPLILPVRFSLAVDRVVLSASVGSALDRATDGTVVAFQADGTDTDPRREWSVSVVGTARHLDEPDAEIADAVRALPRWAPDLPSRLVTISTDRVTGRRTPTSG